MVSLWRGTETREAVLMKLLNNCKCCQSAIRHNRTCGKIEDMLICFAEKTNMDKIKAKI